MKTHGTGVWRPSDFKRMGSDTVIEPGVLVFHAGRIEIGSNVYVGHNAILKGWHKSPFFEIGAGSWIGQQVFMHAAGGIRIGRRVGIGPAVKILTSQHDSDAKAHEAVMDGDLQFAAVHIEDGADIGVGAIILPGVTIGQGAVVGAGAVVTKSVLPHHIVAGNPARVLRRRGRNNSSQAI